MFDFYYSCNFCDVESANVAAFKRHLDGVHFPGESRSPQNITKGRTVDQPQTTPADRGTKLEKADDLQGSITSGTPSTPVISRPDKECTRCDFRTSSSLEMARHFATSCKRTKPTSGDPSPATSVIQRTPDSDSPKLRGCTHCGFKTGSGIEMSKHVRDNHR